MKYKYILPLVTIVFLCDSFGGVTSMSDKTQPLQQVYVKMERASALALLDKVLSPFEDITEYALDADQKKVSTAFYAIDKTQYAVFKSSFSAKEYIALTKKIDLLKKYITAKNYKKTALVSTEIFHYNINHFKYSQLIKEQISIENLDYMGFQILSILYQDTIEYKKVDTLISQATGVWKDLRTQVKDKNIVDSFELMFQGVQTANKQRNVQMIKIFASLDLALVDVLEKQFQ